MKPFHEHDGCRLCLRRVFGAAGYLAYIALCFLHEPVDELLYVSAGLLGLTSLDHFSKRK
jgi:hypothetical protein